jgi:NTE family protein
MLLRSRRLPAAVLTALLAAGCATYRPTNAPMERLDLDQGYRPAVLQARRPVGDVVLLLAFSGGGTRAAALSYGVLLELRDMRVTVDGVEKRLLDEVDVISSVSGGSFTGAYYGLFGDRIFADFEEVFLRRDIQDRLFLELLRPLNWIRLLTRLDRTQIAVEMYDRDIFEHATFADLERAGGPFININATDLAVGNHFTFVQPQFDLICSDLSSYKVAHAVAASSAVPVLFNGIALKNYAGSCGFQVPPMLEQAAGATRTDPRRSYNAKIALSYLDRKKRPYIHLVDGGVSDNIGLRSPLDNLSLAGGMGKRLAMVHVEPPLEFVVVAVNAEVHHDPKFSYSSKSPALSAVVNAITGVQINRYSFETLDLVREGLAKWAQELPPRADGQPTRDHMVEVGFDYLASADDREYFNSLPTSFKLDDEAVDRLIEAGRQLLREDPEFQKLLEELGRTQAP